MSPSFFGGQERRIVLVLFLFWIPFFSHGCAKKTFRHHVPHKEIVRPIPKPQDELNPNPQRKASEEIVRQGTQYYNDGDYDKAERAFQEAINVDVTNGVGYFFLAQTRFQKKEYKEARGMLDKAESLLQDRSDFFEQITELRAKINSGLENKVEEKPPFYY